MPASATITVENLTATLRAVRKIDADLARELNREVYGIGKPIRDRARSFVPAAPPLSHWVTRKTGSKASADGKYSYPWTRQAKTGIVVKRGSGKKASERRLVSRSGSLLTIQQTNQAGAIFDMAGKTGRYTRSPQGRALNRNLHARYGGASRSLWRAAELERANTERAMDTVLDKAQKRISAELA